MATAELDVKFVTHVDNIDRLRSWVPWAFFWVRLHEDVLLIRNIKVQDTYLLILEVYRIRIRHFAELALHDLPLVLNAGWWMDLYSLNSIHPLLQALNVNQTLRSLTVTGVDERVIGRGHLIRKTDSTWGHLFLFLKLNLLREPDRLAFLILPVLFWICDLDSDLVDV